MSTNRLVNFRIIRWLFGIFFFLSHANVNATHIVGGEITYECLGNNQYRIHLVVYRDCFLGQAPFDAMAEVGVYDDQMNLVTSLMMSFPGSNNIPPLVFSPCLTPPTNVCVERAEYIEVVTLPPNGGGYHLVYQRCCRNNSITNIDNPGGTGSTYNTYIPTTPAGICNNSPVFQNFPPIYLCQGVPINFDHSATDADGDSLVYQLCEPFLGGTTQVPTPSPPAPPPFIPVLYNPGFNALNALGGSTNPLTIDPVTGLLTGTPSLLGQFVVAVCVNEYRNGVLLNTTRRDFQFNIVACNAAIASIPAQTTQCDGYDVTFTGSSINGINYFWDFGVAGISTDTSSLQNVVYTYPDSGLYTVMLVAYDPAGNCYDTAYQTFHVLPLLAPSFVSPPNECLGGNNFTFTAGGSFDQSASFLWNFGSSASITTAVTQTANGISYPASGTYPVTLTVSQFGCTETFGSVVNVIDDPTADIGSANQYCVGTQVDFENNSIGADSYWWEFGNPSSNADSSNLFEPFYVYPDSGIYYITLVAGNDGYCFDTIVEPFFVFPLLNPIAVGGGDQCFDSQSFTFSVGGNYDPVATFDWNFGGGASQQSAQVNFISGITYNQPGQYPVTLVVSQFGCHDTTYLNAGVFSNPIASFVLAEADGCSPLKVQFADSSKAETALNYFWSFGDESSSNEQNPQHTYWLPGTYNVQLTVVTTSGCIDTSVYSLPAAITVFPSPEAGLVIEDTAVSAFEPVIQILDTSKLADFCKIYISDGTIYHTCVTAHTFQEVGNYVVSQVVTNQFGCKDSVSQMIYVFPEYRLFIPNCFTPNEDGINDVFLPSYLGAETALLMIFNRWGEKIFEGKSLGEGWDGTHEGKPAPQDAYVYRLVIDPVGLTPRTVTGSVTLLR